MNSILNNHSAVVLVLDQFGANQSSVYGNGVFATPSLNHLAAESLVFDQAHVPTTSPEDYYGQLMEHWRGQSLNPSDSFLLTDSPWLLDHEFAGLFDQSIPLEFDAAESPASSAEETELAQIFAQLVSWLESRPSGSLVWIHLRGLSGAWDAPYQWRLDRADPEDPEPPQMIDPPSEAFNADVDDPDRLLGVQQACAAQVQLFDQHLNALFYLLTHPSGGDEVPLFCMTSLRGMPLGEHGWIGWGQKCDPVQGYNESNHVPLILRFPEHGQTSSSVTGAAAMVRCGSLVNPQRGIGCRLMAPPSTIGWNPMFFNFRVQAASFSGPTRSRLLRCKHMPGS